MKKFSGPLDFAPFTGDGRVRVEPPRPAQFPGLPIAVSNSQARSMIQLFMEFGYSNHSPNARTLWVLMLYAQQHQLKTKLTTQYEQLARTSKVQIASDKVIGYFFERIE